MKSSIQTNLHLWVGYRRTKNVELSFGAFTHS
jgi:hypothetical protein